MRPFIISLIALSAALAQPASAEEREDRILESQNDLGGTVRFHPKRGHRLFGRVVLSQGDGRDRAEASYGLSWMPRKAWAFDLLAGYSYADGHGLLVSIHKDMAFVDGILRLHFENRHRIDGDGYAYEGFYRFDCRVAGVHLFNEGRGVAAGIQFGSGDGLGPFRFEIRLSYGLTDGLPDSIGAFVMVFDLR